MHPHSFDCACIGHCIHLEAVQSLNGAQATPNGLYARPLLCVALSTSLKHQFVSLEQACFCVTGCQLCPTSDFINDCEGCVVEGCQVSCESCLSSNRTVGPPVTFTIPAGGCVAGSTGTSLIQCKNGTEGSCPLGEHSLFPHVFANTSCCYPPKLGKELCSHV